MECPKTSLLREVAERLGRKRARDRKVTEMCPLLEDLATDESEGSPVLESEPFYIDLLKIWIYRWVLEKKSGRGRPWRFRTPCS